MSSKVEDELQRLENDVSLLKGLSDVGRNQGLERQMKEIVYDVQDIRETWLINRAAAAAAAANSNFWRRYLTLDLDEMSVYGIARTIRSTRDGRVDPLIKAYEDLHDVQRLHTKVNQVPLVQLSKEIVPQVRVEKSVGFEDEAESLINCLMQETEELDVISITGMPGIGKTTLARKIYQSKKIRTQFPARIWVDIPHEFCSKDLYLNILKEFNEQDMVDYDEFESLLDMPCSKVSYLDNLNECIKSGRINDHEFHACLKKSTFLLVMDAVWTADALESVRCFLPKTGKVLITTRDNRVTRKPHVLRLLNERESWDLLQLEVFGEPNKCPEKLKPLGERIAKNCDGSPLAILIVASSLVIPSRVQVDDLTENGWMKVSEQPTKYITEYGAHHDLFKRVELSYIQLPQYLQDCFLYLGVFPDDDEISVWTLIRLWIAEGLVQDSWGLTLEETAERNLYDLISRNLVVVGKIYPNGHIKTCRLHPLMYGFCRRKAVEQEFYHEIKVSEGGALDCPMPLTPNHRRLCINSCLQKFLSSRPKGPSIRSLLCLNKEGEDLDPKDSSTILRSFKLLKIFACKGVKFTEFPIMLSKLMNLRYISLSCDDLAVIPESVSSLCCLETLVVDTQSASIQLKANIWRMFQLRHLVTKAAIVLAIRGKGEAGKNLQTLTRLAPESCTEEMLTRTPNLKTLGIRGNLASLPSAESLKTLKWLQHLKLIHESAVEIQQDHLDCFPSTLKRLTLSGTYLKWECMSILGKIGGLEILKLKNNAFIGEYWRSTDATAFGSLRFLLIRNSDLESWEASPDCFPNLKCLVLKNCEKLDKIPSTLANSLDRVDVDNVPILQLSLSLEIGLPPTAQNYSTFLRLHMNEDETFLSARDERLDAEIRRIAVETGREDRLAEVYLEVVRPDRSRLYGTGSAGRSQVGRGSSQSTGTSMMSQQLYETRISMLEERLQAEQAAREAEREASRAEQEALQQRMAQIEEFMRRMGQLP